jgi:2-keto-3-deoxy-L-rhamnonate aldolase RhmA
MELIYITNNPELAEYAQNCGVDRIMVDLEYIGKKERQKGLDTLISYHSIEDISNIKKVLSKSKLQVRVNPLYKNSEKEINESIERGADIIMLPMFKTKEEVEKFLSIVDERAEACLLLETPQALVRIDEILQVGKIDEVYIGLNDLSLLMGLDFLFELLSGGIVEYLAEKIKKRGIRFGFGGITRLGEGVIDSRLILSEHVRLGSQVVILSREFHKRAKTIDELKKFINLEEEIKKIRSYVYYLSKLPKEELLLNREKLSYLVSELVSEYVKKYSSSKLKYNFPNFYA